MNFFKLLCAVALFSVLLISCQKDAVILEPEPSAPLSNEIALEWNKLLLEVERFTPGYKPPVSARSTAYIGLTAYEAFVHGMPEEFNSFSGVFDGLNLPQPDPNKAYDWEVCLNAAYEAAFYYYFPVAPASQQFQILAQANRLRKRLEEQTSQQVYNQSAQLGAEIAHAIYEWSKKDHWGHEAYLKNNDINYVPVAGSGLWRPTYPDYSPALLPHWGKVRTFAASAADRVAAPLQFSEDPSSALYQQAKATQDLVNKIKNGEKKEDRWVAEFWSDDCPILTFTPAGRWISIANQVVEKEKVPLYYAVYTYAKVGMALCDAGIRCWGEKYVHNCERPIDYIRRVMNDANWNTIMCPDGSGQYYTPNFPTYPSGHATFSAAAAEVLTNLYGDDYAMIDRCHENRTEFQGAPRAFNSFYEMAYENAYSRIPIGVHFAMDSEAGTDLGLKVGRKVNALPWKK